MVCVTQECLTPVACPLVYGGHLSSTDLCPQVSSCQLGGGTRPSGLGLAQRDAGPTGFLEDRGAMPQGVQDLGCCEGSTPMALGLWL